MAFKNKATLIAKMTDKFDLTLADEIMDVCAHHGEDPFVAVIHPDRLGSPATYAAWTSETAKQYIDAGMAKRRAKKAKKGSTSPLFSDNALIQAKAAVALLSQFFVVTAENGATLYRILNHDHRIVRVCEGEDQNAFVSQAIKHALWQHDLPASNKLSAHLLDLFISNVDMQPAPKLWLQHGEPGYCLGRALVLPDDTVRWPHFRSFIDRMNDPAAFSGWFWGVYAGLYRGRQVPYISDTTGQGAKSSALRALERLFCHGVPDGEPPTITAAFNANILRDSSHASSMFAGKKFTWCGDNKSPNAIMSQAVKELSGDDMSMLNPKHQPAYSTYLEAFLVILSNVEPNITSEKHNTSRTLWIKLAPLEIADKDVAASYADNFAKEMPGFLAYARRCYEERCTHDTVIHVNDAVREATALKIREYEDQFSVPFEANFKIDPAATLSAPELHDILIHDLKWNEHKVGHFKEWLERTYEITKSTSRKGGWCYNGLRRKRGSDSYHEHMADAPDEAAASTAANDWGAPDPSFEAVVARVTGHT